MSALSWMVFSIAKFSKLVGALAKRWEPLLTKGRLKLWHQLELVQFVAGAR